MADQPTPEPAFGKLHRRTRRRGSLEKLDGERAKFQGTAKPTPVAGVTLVRLSRWAFRYPKPIILRAAIKWIPTLLGAASRNASDHRRSTRRRVAGRLVARRNAASLLRRTSK